ncbi:MAG: pyrimidine 5'-nucleotidase [Desulfuromonas sp.]|nr:MAG: pyrimidine 5'-nucleotidase [Desulfuromonas sp.]
MKTLLFDLDNTLYAPECDLFSLIDVRINRYMQEVVGIAEGEVDGLRRQYWADYGVTLQGLIRHHGVDPDDYLHYVHDVDVATRIGPDPQLRQTLERLPQRKAVFTNGSHEHAVRVLKTLEITDCFDAIFDIRIADYIPKPHPQPYQNVLDRLDATPGDCVMIEDTEANLRTAKALGMRTVLVGGKRSGEFVDHHILAVGAIASTLSEISPNKD